MGMDISCIGGIGFEISELLSMYDDHELNKEYYDDDNHDKRSFLEEFFSGVESVDVQSLHSYDDTEYYILAEDPIKGVQAFIEALIKLGFEDLDIDDLEFYSAARVW